MKNHTWSARHATDVYRLRALLRVSKRGTNVYPRCKGIGHAFDDAPRPEWAQKTPDGYGDMHFRCEHCGTIKRVRLYLRDGTHSLRYWYPDDWSEVTDTKSEWKLAYYRAVKRRGGAS